MAKAVIDLSGRAGLAERFQGDMDDSSSNPHLRYLGEDGQFAEGTFNAFKKYGYLHPGVDQFIALEAPTGGALSNSETIISIQQLDGGLSEIFLAGNQENIYSMVNLNDASINSYISLTSGWNIKDMIVAELNERQALFYVVDTGDPAYYNEASSPEEGSVGGMFVGFDMPEVGTGDSKPVGIVEEDRSLPISANGTDGTFAQRIDDGTNFSTKLAQNFLADNHFSGHITGVGMRLRRVSGGAGSQTVKVSIQGDADRNSGLYTYRGAWSNSTTDYVKNDTVTYNSEDYLCIQAHDASSETNDEPGVGADWRDFWDVFGAPDGTDLISTEVLLSQLPDTAGLLNVSAGSLADLDSLSQFHFVLGVNNEILDLTKGETYWIVVEEGTLGTAWTSSDVMGWYTSTNNSDLFDGTRAIYFDGTVWNEVNPNPGETETRDFVTSLYRDDNWSSNSATNYFVTDPNQDTFLHLSDNKLIYWVTGNSVHTLNGSVTGGVLGRVNKNVLQFPKYMTVSDIAETRTRMYIGIQSSEITTGHDNQQFTSEKVGVFVWDRQSQILGSTDFYAAPGAKEIKALFVSSSGSVRAITVNTVGFTELRGISGNQFEVLHTFDIDGFPANRSRCISQLNNFSVWFGINGVCYAYGRIAPGENERLYKIGKIDAVQTDNSTTESINSSEAVSAIRVLNESSSPDPSILVAGKGSSTNPGYLARWYVNGEGSKSDNGNSINLTAEQGDAYTLLEVLPTLSKVHRVNIRCAPTSTGSTTIATVKYYFNQSSTPSITKTVTKDQASRGYVDHLIEKDYINTIQIEIEWDTSETLGADVFLPSVAVITYDEMEARSPTKD